MADLNPPTATSTTSIPSAPPIWTQHSTPLPRKNPECNGRVIRPLASPVPMPRTVQPYPFVNIGDVKRVQQTLNDKAFQHLSTTTDQAKPTVDTTVNSKATILPTALPIYPDLGAAPMMSPVALKDKPVQEKGLLKTIGSQLRSSLTKATEPVARTDPLLGAIKYAVQMAKVGAVTRSAESVKTLQSAIRTAEEQHGQVLLLRDQVQIYPEGSEEKAQIEQEIREITRSTFAILKDMETYWAIGNGETSVYLTANESTADTTRSNTQEDIKP